MAGKTAALIGATGLIGSEVLKLLIQDPSCTSVKLIVRRPLTITESKVQVIVIDFADEHVYKESFAGCDVVFCAIGTTQQKVKGDKNAYRKVDYDIPVNAARFGAESSVQHFLLVSSVGANSGSNNFYLKLKGEVEDAIASSGIPTISIFRPSLLLGAREEFRLGEKITQTIMPVFSFLIPAKYKPIKAETVAKAMVETSKTNKQGSFIYNYKEMTEK